MSECSDCNGRGDFPCDECCGTGYLICESCDGAGEFEEDEDEDGL